MTLRFLDVKVKAAGFTQNRELWHIPLRGQTFQPNGIVSEVWYCTGIDDMLEGVDISLDKAAIIVDRQCNCTILERGVQGLWGTVEHVCSASQNKHKWKVALGPLVQCAHCLRLFMAFKAVGGTTHPEIIELDIPEGGCR